MRWAQERAAETRGELESGARAHGAADADEALAGLSSLFVGAMLVGAMPRSGHLERIPFSEHGELGREWLLADLEQRIRHVRQGPDGLLYVLTAEVEGALLVIEPVGR